MARVNFKVKKYVDPLHRAVAELEGFDQEMQKVGEEGVDVAQTLINSRPSALSGKPGRATGTDYAADVDYKVTSTAKYRFVLRIGWLNRQLEWYRLQESGFWHVRAQRWIEGTDALEDTARIVEADMERAKKKFARRIEALAVGRSR